MHFVQCMKRLSRRLRPRRGLVRDALHCQPLTEPSVAQKIRAEPLTLSVSFFPGIRKICDRPRGCRKTLRETYLRVDCPAVPHGDGLACDHPKPERSQADHLSATRRRDLPHRGDAITTNGDRAMNARQISSSLLTTFANTSELGRPRTSSNSSSVVTNADKAAKPHGTAT